MLIKLRVEQAGVEALLARRSKAEDAATDSSRKEVSRMKDQLASLIAQRAAIEGEATQVGRASSVPADDSSELTDLQAELEQMEEVSRKINSELEMLNVEIQAPSRIRLIEDAGVSPKAKFAFHPSS